MELPGLAAAVSAQAADLNVYAGFLFAALDGALPPEYLTVERRSSLAGRLRGRAPEVVAVSVRLGESLFVLRRASVGAAVDSSIAHQVNGIVLSRQSVPLAQWSQALAVALTQQAEANSAIATALQKLTDFTV
jgi:predicted deacylase